MLATRAPLLSRAIAQMARNGKLLTVATVKNQSKQLQLQPVRFSGHWTYRTGSTTVPMYKRVWGQTMCACKWFYFDHRVCDIHLICSVISLLFCPISSSERLNYDFSYVVVDSVAFVLGLGSYCRWIWISRYIKVDRCRTWNSTRRSWWIIKWLWDWITLNQSLHMSIVLNILKFLRI